jgi:hypothetical protein
MDARDAIVESERLGEAAYAAMYDARPHGVKDCYEDALVHFGRAIETARRACLADEVTRLSRRAEHIERVYNSQFRGVGR